MNRRLPLTLLLFALLAAAMLATSVAASAATTRSAINSTVALVDRGKPAIEGQFCGGTVIAPRAVLTAAHCVEGNSASKIDIVAGRTRLSDEDRGRRIAVTAIDVHPGWDTDTLRHDLAILHLASDARVAAVALARDNENIAGGIWARIVGWGRSSNSADDVGTDARQTARLLIRSNSTCRRAYGSTDFVSRWMICAGGPDADACQGDSGGPLVVGSPVRLVGVVSFGGERCGDPDVPGVYARVSTATTWIRQAAGIR